jgi:general secretion pathway protein D
MTSTSGGGGLSVGTITTGAVADISNIGGLGTGPGGATGGAVSSVRAANATVSADVNTNSIIVIAQPAVQQLYADLIKRLDERRPQVQIECTIVTLDTTDNFQLAVDLTQVGGFGAYQTLAFSSFGVSTLDPLTGNLTPKAATGGTFALLSPGNANAVLKTLKQSSRSRLVSAPQLLVNDNGKGQLVSVDSEPFAQIIDSTSSQAITSFGGQATAGTTIAVQPHISEDDYLQLDYSVELSSFTGASSNGLPPPSQRNQVTSTVTIPDGYTIVVGGLANKNLRKAADVIPILGDIPVLEWVFGAHSSNKRDTTLFVFIRPIILRNDKFEDLKYLSSKRVEQMNLAGDFPSSEPIPLK